MKKVLLAFMLFGPFLISAQTVKPNIVFIVIDDLNDYIEGFEGHPQTTTPTIKSISDKGTLFLNAYCSAPQCGPSRTSFITGKDLAYTQVYHNNDLICSDFRDNFTEEKGNAEVFTFAEIMKDSGGYFTFSINKVIHCTQNAPDYDSLTTDACARELSWNKVINFETGESPIIHDYGVENNDGLNGFNYARIPNSLEVFMEDYIATDSAINFIHAYAADAGQYCDKPFMLAMGYRRPHGPLYVPEKYFYDDFITDIYEEPFDLPYNDPVGEFPYNGIVMPPQPDPMWSDYDSLPVGGVARALIEESYVHKAVLTYGNQFVMGDSLPFFSDTLTDDQRRFIVEESKRANNVIAYLAAIKFVDAQISRFYETMQAYPDILNNTVFIITSDHGYSLGEKTHWRKGGLWETDTRVPFLITDMREPVPQVCNRFVSLLDVFPTVCDYGSAAYPKFSDGSDYLDGFSLLPLMSDPGLSWYRPVLTSFRNTSTGDLVGHCFPHYSVRSGDFHYIKYKTDGTIPGGCDDATSEIQRELYHIGYNKEVDPYEWVNLAADTAYADMIDSLETYLPSGVNYLQFSTAPADTTDTTIIMIEHADASFKSLYVYPNPAHTYCIVTTKAEPGDAVLKIYNMMGDEVYTKPIVADYEGIAETLLPLNNYSSGIYFIAFEQKDTHLQKKIVITK